MSNCTPYHVLYWDPSAHIITISVFAFLYTSVFFFGLAGNLAVIYVTLKNRSLQTVQNLFIINLAVSDIILCLLSIPLTPVTQIYKEWYFGAFLCRLVGGIQASASFIGSFSLCAIAIDRYFCLVVAPGRPLTRRSAVRITWGLWFASVLFTLPYVVHMKIIRYEKENICGNFCTEKWPTEKSKRIYTFIVLFVQAFIPFSIMAVSYHQIFAFLRQRAHNRLTSIAQQANMLYLLAATAGGETSQHKEQLGHLIDQKNRLIRQKRRVTLILCLMVVLFGLTSLPHNIVSVITEFDNEYEIFILEDGTDITYLASLFSHFVAMTSCVINPILYGMLNPEFRDVIVKNLKWAPRFVSTIPTQISAIGATQV